MINQINNSHVEVFCWVESRVYKFSIQMHIPIFLCNNRTDRTMIKFTYFLLPNFSLSNKIHFNTELYTVKCCSECTCRSNPTIISCKKFCESLAPHSCRLLYKFTQLKKSKNVTLYKKYTFLLYCMMYSIPIKLLIHTPKPCGPESTHTQLLYIWFASFASTLELYKLTVTQIRIAYRKVKVLSLKYNSLHHLMCNTII